jgi:pyruvate dehydrogenase E1 component
MASTIPNCVSYDPTYAFELAVIVQDGLKRMYELQENKFYYITAMNENYTHPEMPVGVEEGIIKGIYPLIKSPSKSSKRVQLMGSGTILREVEAAVELLQNDWDVAADVWSITSSNELRRDGLACERWNMLHPNETPRVPYITEQLKEAKGPFIAATDYMKLYSDQLRPYIPGNFKVLGTDGFGRSDTRAKLRHFFEVNRYFVVIAALGSLVKEGTIKADVVAEAIKKYGISPDKIDPVTV